LKHIGNTGLIAERQLILLIEDQCNSSEITAANEIINNACTTRQTLWNNAASFCASKLSELEMSYPGEEMSILQSFRESSSYYYSKMKEINNWGYRNLMAFLKNE